MIRLDSSLLHIGQNRQLFFDNKILERAQDIRRAFHSPRAEPEPVMQADEPWETISYFAVGTGHVIRDSDGAWGPYLNDECILTCDPVIRLYVANVRSPYQGHADLGHARENFDIFTGDSVQHVCTWQGRPEAEFHGYHKLVFYMRKAELYSFQSTSDPGNPSSVDPDLARKLSVRKWE